MKCEWNWVGNEIFSGKWKPLEANDQRLKAHKVICSGGYSVATFRLASRLLGTDGQWILVTTMPRSVKILLRTSFTLQLSWNATTKLLLSFFSVKRPSRGYFSVKNKKRKKKQTSLVAPSRSFNRNLFILTVQYIFRRGPHLYFYSK